MIDSARQRLDDQRRAQAEVKVQSAEKKRGVVLYAVIALAVVGLGVGGYFGYQAMQHHEEDKVVATVSGLDGAQLKVTVNMPKVPPAKHHSSGGNRGKNWGPGNTNENLALDLSDDSDETETLGMDKV